MSLEQHLQDKLIAFASALIDQEAARLVIPPQKNGDGFWFGGGNIVPESPGGNGDGLLLCGRYRNFGDSRTGVGAGERGLELAVFRADSHEGPWEKVHAFSKEDLSNEEVEVVSIEGASLLPAPDGHELFVSTEKGIAYPPGIAEFQKEGTGVWSIDRMTGFDVETLTPVRSSENPTTLHIKDPVAFSLGETQSALIYCSHPFNWSSSNSGLAIREGSPDAVFESVTEEVMPRGPVWDVAATRITERLSVPRVGAFANLLPVSLYFYDGAECLRSLDANPAAVKRPRGYSCEELGGLAWGYDSELPRMERLSINAPLFVSPHGTGCSRYVSAVTTRDGVFATWQQSQGDLSQPLMGHFLSHEAIHELLG